MADLDARQDRLCRLLLTGVEHCAILLLDPDGRVVRWNKGAEQLYGYAAPEVMGQPVATFYDIDDVLRGEPASDLAAAKEGHLRHEGWQRRADGSRFWAEVVFSPIRDRDEELLGVGVFVRDITESRRFQRELMRRALHDTLTGLPNRALFLDRLRKAIARLERHPEPAAVYFVDLDRFKAINDSLGHRTGDLVLAAVGQRLQSVLRTHDTVARLSGDEFVVLCERLDGPTAAADIAARLVEALQAPVMVTDEPVALHASIGVVVVCDPGEEAEAALDRADTAMYRAKRRGGSERIHVEFGTAH